MLKKHFGPKNKWLLVHRENSFQEVFWKFRLKRILSNLAKTRIQQLLPAKSENSQL